MQLMHFPRCKRFLSAASSVMGNDKTIIKMKSAFNVRLNEANYEETIALRDSPFKLLSSNEVPDSKCLYLSKSLTIPVI